MIEFNCQLTAWKNGVITAMCTMEIVANSALIEKEPKCHVDKGFDNSESTRVLLLERGIQEMVLKYYAFWGLTFVQKNPVQMITF